MLNSLQIMSAGDDSLPAFPTCVRALPPVVIEFYHKQQPAFFFLFSFLNTFRLACLFGEVSYLNSLTHQYTKMSAAFRFA